MCLEVKGHGRAFFIRLDGQTAMQLIFDQGLHDAQTQTVIACSAYIKSTSVVNDGDSGIQVAVRYLNANRPFSRFKNAYFREF